MFQKDHIPILIDLPNTLDYADIYFIHDVHYGSELFDDRKWEELKKKKRAEELEKKRWLKERVAVFTICLRKTRRNPRL